MKARAALLIVCGLAAAGAPLAAQCAANEPNHVTWPAANPVWDFCWGRPSSGGRVPDGDGIRISDIKYKGVLFLKLGHIPILNVKYTPGSAHCGAPLYCYRDWLYEESNFQCAPAVGGAYCSGTTTPAQTGCDHPGTDAGSYSGVAVEDLGDRLRLTSQCSAGWYRYIPVWEFFPDGTIKASMDASAVDDACVTFTHSHHAYFRLDFDIAGDGNNDFVDLVNPDTTTTRVTTEQHFIDTSPSRSHWRIGSAGSGVTVDVVRNPEDGAAGDTSAVPTDFPVADGWVVAYKSNELTDGGGPTLGLDCAAQVDKFLNSENVNGADLVLWVRGGAVHEGEPTGALTGAAECVKYGPTIKVSVPNRAPGAVLGADPVSGNTGLSVNFNGGASTDPDSGDTIASYAFDFGDGSPVVTQAGATITHAYHAVGSFVASLAVTDNQGLASAGASTQLITILNRPPVAALGANITSGAAPIAVNFDAAGSSDPDDGDSVTSYRFDFGDGSPAVTQGGATASHTYSSPGSYTASVVATDGHGAPSVNPASVAIHVVAGFDFYATTPCRQVDSRSGLGLSGPLVAGAPAAVTLTGGACGLPAGASAVSLNLTVVAPTASGQIIAYPDAGPAPGTSTISFAAGQTRANNAVLALGTGGTLQLLLSDGQAGLIIDVNGYFR